MKKNILYLLLGILALTSSCQDPEYVLPTADRQQRDMRAKLSSPNMIKEWKESGIRLPLVLL